MPWAHDYGTVNSTNELLGKVRDFLLGVGWTVADDYTSLAVPFVAMRSTGESGDKPWGIFLDRIPAVEGLNTCVFRSWQPVAPYWTPNPGTVRYVQAATFYFEGQAGAPSFLDRFAVGDTVWGFNPTTGSNRHQAMQGRFPIGAVTATRLTLELAAGYVTPGSWNATADPSLVLTKGGPFLLARAPDISIDGTAPTVPGSATPFAYFLFGDRETLLIVTRIGSTYTGTYLGWVTPYHDPRTATTLTELVAGVSTSVQVSDPTLFAVGCRYQLMTDMIGHTFKVTAINGPTLTCSAGLTAGPAGTVYPVGSRCGEDLFPVCRATLRLGTTGNTCPGDGTCLSAGAAGLHSATLQGVQYTRNASIAAAFGGYASPDVRRTQTGFLPLYLGMTGDCRGTLRRAYQLNTGPGSSEDVIRLGVGGPTYKLFQIGGTWFAVEE
jgi:hypothetical protein